MNGERGYVEIRFSCRVPDLSGIGRNAPTRSGPQGNEVHCLRRGAPTKRRVVDAPHRCLSLRCHDGVGRRPIAGPTRFDALPGPMTKSGSRGWLRSEPIQAL
jgi:hypothetical protein